MGASLLGLVLVLVLGLVVVLVVVLMSCQSLQQHKPQHSPQAQALQLLPTSAHIICNSCGEGVASWRSSFFTELEEQFVQ